MLIAPILLGWSLNSHFSRASPISRSWYHCPLYLTFFGQTSLDRIQLCIRTPSPPPWISEALSHLAPSNTESHFLPRVWLEFCCAPYGAWFMVVNPFPRMHILPAAPSSASWALLQASPQPQGWRMASHQRAGAMPGLVTEVTWNPVPVKKQHTFAE